MASPTPHNTTRLEERRDALKDCFKVPRMIAAWERYVRDGMRKQEILDLHDYYDFHRHRTATLAKYRSEILTGRYKPRTPITIRLEKKVGLTRRLSVPTVEDAVILQTLVEKIYPSIKKAQPSANAFYSRSHGFVAPEIKLDDFGEYFWFIHWKKFAEKRFAFTSAFEYICITDIANYFDNIDFRHLRNILSSIVKADEVIFDILFMILEGLSWNPGNYHLNSARVMRWAGRPALKTARSRCPGSPSSARRSRSFWITFPTPVLTG